MTDTTSLADLPTVPIEADPVQLKTTEKNVKIDNPSEQLKQERAMDDANMNALVTGIQQASTSGALNLPQRDVPTNEDHLVQDQQTKANFIPQQQIPDYIRQNETTDDLVRQHAEKQQAINNGDDIFDKLQTPIILALIYLVFHTPAFRNFIFLKLPVLFAKDGHMNTSGSLLMSITFALTYMGIMYSLEYLSV